MGQKVQVSYSSLPESASGPSHSSLPDYDYPVPFVIRNTFIDVPRPLSFEEFYAERKIHSCPVAPPPGLETSSHIASDEEVASQLRRAMAQGGGMMASVAAAAAAASAAAAAATMCWMTKPTGSMQSPMTPPSQPLPVASPTATALPAGAPVLRLADALGGPELGSPEMPTAGSAGHRLGTCRPCAFYHTKGCGNGVNCTFCHLCPPGEKKRRQKEKAADKRTGFP